MYKIYLGICFVLLFSCQQKKFEHENLSEQQVASTFVNSVFQADWDKAEKLILGTEKNIEIFNTLKKQSYAASNEEKAIRKESNAILFPNEVINDSIVIIYYAPSAKMENKQKLKMVYQNKKWWVDLEYTVSGNF